MSIDDMINTIVCGDCLEVMRGLPDGVFDALVTDPPYSSGGQFRSDRSQSVAVKYVQTDSVQTCRTDFTGDNRDQRAFLVWCTMWLSEAFRLTRPGGICAIFTDWRQLPTMTDAIQCGGWVWRNIVTWWKPGIRSDYERVRRPTKRYGTPCKASQKQGANRACKASHSRRENQREIACH
jgi:site-specific DNA-methyltransferase (adenine-specific)